MSAETKISREDREYWNKLFAELDTEQMMKQVFWDGFDSWDDYVLFGDLFPYKIEQNEPPPKK